MTFDAKLTDISANPILLFDEEERKQLSYKAQAGEIAGLNDVQKIALAEKIDKFLTENAVSISKLDLGLVISCLQKLKDKCNGLGSDSNEKIIKALTKINNLMPLQIAAINKASPDVIAMISHGKITPQEAQSLLNGKPPGTFLLRDSEVQAGVKIFNYVDKDGKFSEYRVLYKANGYIDKEKKFYPSLEKFLETKKDTLKQPYIKTSPAKVVPLPAAPVNSPADKAVLQPATPNKFSAEIVAQVNMGKISPQKAQSLLQNKAPGTFLLRDSDTLADVKIFNYVTNDGSIKEFRLFLKKDKKYGEISGSVYDSLEHFLEMKKNILTKPYKDKKPEPPAVDKGPPISVQTSPAGVKLKEPALGKAGPPKKEIPPPKMFQDALKVKEALFMDASLVKEPLEGKGNAEELLVQAVKDGKADTAEWLLKNGASINALSKIPNKTAAQQELCAWLEKIANVPPITPVNVDALAIGLGYGYKGANLMIMQAKASVINEKLKATKSTTTVKVPPFLPVGDFQMQQHLMKALPNLQQRWLDFLDSFDPGMKEQFLKAKGENEPKVPIKISPKGLEIIADIQKQIMDHFIKDPYYTLQMDEWLKKENPDFVIVRSTGKEDSDTNSNAGGNASIPFVKPDPYAISDAIGQVLASYFGRKSIEQRLLAGDQSLFKETKPFLPVLLQSMIGENVGGAGSQNEDIPRSGVLFTRQQDKAKGVTLIQTGLGNNEGVVSSRVAVDSYYVGDDKKIHAVVRNKATRFVSVEEDGKYKAEPIKNKNPVLENRQALPNPVILGLKVVADDIAESYAAEAGGAKAMDMEYTVKLKDKSTGQPVIYLLQARPLQNIQGQKAIPKSFLDMNSIKALPNEAKVQAQTLLDGNAYIREVQSPEDVLFVDDLPKALDGYIHADDPQKIKVIVVKKTAPATSHEAVTLRPKGVAVMVVENPQQFEHVKQLVEKAGPDKPLLFDPQRGMIVDTHQVQDVKGLIKQGLISYPIPLEASIPQKGLSAISAVVKADKKSIAEDKWVKAAQYLTLENTYNKLMSELSGGKPLLPMGAEDKDGYNLRVLLDEMAMGDTIQAKLALATILNHMHSFLNQQMKVKAGDPPAEINKPLYQVFSNMVRMAKDEIVPALEQHAPQSLERLYPIKFLDALIFQWPSGGVVSQYSCIQAMNEALSDKKAIAQASLGGISIKGPLAFKHLQLEKLGNAAYSPECEKNWHDFLGEIVKASKSDPKYLNDTIKLVMQAMKMNMAPAWLNILFNKTWMENAGKKNQGLVVLDALINLQAKDKQSLEWVMERTQELNIAENQIDQWSHPEFVKKNIPKLRDLFINKLGFDPKAGPNSLKVQMDASGQFGKFAILQYMRRAYDIYDKTIKAVKGSTEYSDEIEQVKDFGEMLKAYFEMMEACMKLIPPDEEKIMMKPVFGPHLTFQDYTQRFHNGFIYQFGFHAKEKIKAIGFDELVKSIDKNNYKDQMEARPGFGVDSLIIGSKIDYNQGTHWPTRLEEYFTAFHQNMEKVVKHLNTKSGMNNELFTGLPRVVSDMVSQQYKTALTYINTEGKNIEAAYTIAMRQHSSEVKVIFNPRAPEKGVDLFINLFGPNEHDRWDHAATIGALIAHSGPTPFAGGFPPKINYTLPMEKREAVSFSLHLPANYPDAKKIIDKLHWTMMVMSMQHGINVPTEFKKELEKKIGPIEWNNINEGFYADSFYLNTAMMDEYSTANNAEWVGKIAKNSLLGLARQNLKDYTQQQKSNNLSGYLGAPEYAHVRGNVGNPPPNSLRLNAVLHLIKLLNENFDAAKPIIISILENPDVKKKFPDVIADLKHALESVKTPDEKFKLLFSQGNIAEAYLLGVKLKNNQMIGQIEEYIKSNIQNIKKRKELLETAESLYKKGMFDVADNLILKKLPNMSSFVQTQFDQIKQTQNRGIHLKDLAKNAAIVREQGLDFNKNYKTVLDSCAKGLIGLSQNSTFHESFGSFGGLGKYLGSSKYSYIYDNKHGDTSKLRKAAPIYIIMGFESANPEIKKEAINALEKLAADYQSAGKAPPNGADYAAALLAISRGFYDSMPDKDLALKELVRIWNKDAEFLQKLTTGQGGPISQSNLSKALA